MPIRPRRSRTRPWSTRAKLTSWSGPSKPKKNNFCKRSERCSKCSQSSTWANWTRACSAANWSNWTKPVNNCVTTLKWWTTWPWPRRKNSSISSKSSSTRRSSLTSPSHIYLISMRIPNSVERLIMRLIRRRPILVKEVWSLRMIFKLEVWV